MKRQRRFMLVNEDTILDAVLLVVVAAVFTGSLYVSGLMIRATSPVQSRTECGR